MAYGKRRPKETANHNIRFLRQNDIKSWFTKADLHIKEQRHRFDETKTKAVAGQGGIELYRSTTEGAYGVNIGVSYCTYD